MAASTAAASGAGPKVPRERPPVPAPRLAVKASTVPGAGFGLFADEPLGAYVVLGEMKGAHRSYAELGQKVQRVGHDALHPFYVGPGVVIDPTDEDGQLDPASLSMAFANEAPPGQGYNVLAMYSVASDDELPGVYFVTRQAVEEGSELFVCYGYDYDRVYETALPDRQEDVRLRAEVSQRHPWLSPQFPLEGLEEDREEVTDSPQKGSSDNEAEPARGGGHEVGTEEWRTDLSDVVLPLPVYDSDSEDEEAPGPAAASGTAGRIAPAPWEELPPARVLALMHQDENHMHQRRRLCEKPRPEPFPGVAGVRRLDAATAAAELDKLVGSETDAGEPVILLGLADTWRAKERWCSAEAFTEHYGSMPLKVYDLASLSGMGKVTELWLPVRDFVEYATTTTADAPFYVFQKKFVAGIHDHLFEDYSRPDLFADDLWSLTPELRGAFEQNRFFCLGGERTGSGLHVDPHFTGAWNTLLCGEKRWVLFPPEVTPAEIGVPEELREKLTTPCTYWWHDWYPRLAGPGGRGAALGMREVIQRPGETIYVPAGWWHAVLNYGWTIAVTENQLAPGALARSWDKLLRGNRRLARYLAQAVCELRPELLEKLPESLQVEAKLTEFIDTQEKAASEEEYGGFRMW